MKKNSLLFAIVGLCALVAVMCGGVAWLLGLINASWGFLSLLKQVASIILTVAAVVIGWIWLAGCKFNKTAKLVLQILFLVFAVLAVIGFIGI